ncbi:MAG TPA: recombinase family protein [Egibacteraceae bacterium]|nr:recombinase family protein [Egibacteraceae bacterium]
MTQLKSHVKAAAIYARISQDRRKVEEGGGLGVQRQEELCRQLAGAKGWPVAEVYVDNDRSAYSRKRRPAYERMLADLEAGVRDAVICVDQDRLTRHLMELEDFIAFADRHSIPLANVSGDVDLSTSDGRFRARIMGAVARQESEKKSERIRRERDQRAKAGKPHPLARSFGFELGHVAHRADEASLIRAAAADILAGRSLRSVVEEWNEAGVKSSRGKSWNVNRLRDVLRRADIAGLRQHRGEIVGDGAWEPILDRRTWDGLQAVFAARTRPGRPPRRLLTGLLRCGRCDGLMTSHTDHGTPFYACRRVVGQPGRDGHCGRVSIKGDPLDEVVVDAVLHALASPALAAALASRDREAGDDHAEAAAELHADERALEQLASDHYVDRLISRREFLTARDALERRIAAARRRLSVTPRTTAVEGLPSTVEELRRWWDATTDTARRRAVLAAVLERVVITPRRDGVPRRFDAGRAQLVWRA